MWGIDIQGRWKQKDICAFFPYVLLNEPVFLLYLLKLDHNSYD